MKYVSDLKELENRKFDSVKELEAAELEIKKAALKKEADTKLRKQDATKVEDAFKARNIAAKHYNTKIVEIRKEYNKRLLEEKKAFEEAVVKLEKELAEADEAYNKALKEFTDKHPEGYHMTLKDGDNVTTISRSGNANVNDIRKAYSAFDDLLDTLFTGFIW